MPDLALELMLGGIVAGVDEAGRGPLAGPVVAAAVVIDRDCLSAELAAQIDDSKRVPRDRRQAIHAALASCARIGVGAASVAEIDRLNILAATMLAMRRAVARLGPLPDHVLVDGNRAPALPCPVRTVVGGDGLSLSIAAASIVAKVVRDRLMHRLDGRHPGYGWRTNVGYGTAEHHAALSRLGATRHHRTSFAPVFNILSLSSTESLDIDS